MPGQMYASNASQTVFSNKTHHLSVNLFLTRALSKDSDQPAHSHILIRIFTAHILESQGRKVEDAQADLILRWARISDVYSSCG